MLTPGRNRRGLRDDRINHPGGRLIAARDFRLNIKLVT
jgi:hypothetical protein